MLSGLPLLTLNVQYRMHACIQGWSSAQLYASRLQPAPEVAAHLLSQLPAIETNEVWALSWLDVFNTLVRRVYKQMTEAPFVFVDTSGCGLLEDNVDENISKSNQV
jgi:superfamily I DNA and/or RNA helicase